MRRITLLLPLFSLLLVASAARADLTGICDSLLGRMAGDWHRVLQGNTGQCADLSATVGDFVVTGCVPLLDSGQLFNANISPDLPLIQAACTALVCDCGLTIPECTAIVSCS